MILLLYLRMNKDSTMLNKSIPESIFMISRIDDYEMDGITLSSAFSLSLATLKFSAWEHQILATCHK